MLCTHLDKDVGQCKCVSQLMPKKIFCACGASSPADIIKRRVPAAAETGVQHARDRARQWKSSHQRRAQALPRHVGSNSCSSASVDLSLCSHHTAAAATHASGGAVAGAAGWRWERPLSPLKPAWTRVSVRRTRRALQAQSPCVRVNFLLLLTPRHAPVSRFRTANRWAPTIWASANGLARWDAAAALEERAQKCHAPRRDICPTAFSACRIRLAARAVEATRAAPSDRAAARLLRTAAAPRAPGACT